PKTNTAEKCSLCYHRITKGLTTACCEACPTGARQLADLKRPEDPIHEYLRTHSVQILKPHMATGAKVFYNGMDGSVRSTQRSKEARCKSRSKASCIPTRSSSNGASSSSSIRSSRDWSPAPSFLPLWNASFASRPSNRPTA